MNGISRLALIGMVAGCILLMPGCANGPGVDVMQQSGGSAALFGQFQAFDGRTGGKVSFEQLVARGRSADVIILGEEHSDVVCNAIEAQLLVTLSEQPRPMTLAMEFFEADTQPALDAYLNGRLAEDEFRKLTRQNSAYLLAHRPLIEYCRHASLPVVAANAPRRLTRTFRLSGKPYDQFRCSLDPADRAWLPRTSDLLTGPYHDRFVKAMAGHEMPTTQPAASQPDHAELVLRSYRAQSMWDDAMAESVANQRAKFQNRRVMLVVGEFHMEREGGTLVKLRRRRPMDAILTIVYRGTARTSLTFDKDDRGAGDVVIYGIKPPEEEESGKPAPTSAPTSAPASASPGAK